MPVAPKQIAQDGAATGQLLMWDGTVWSPTTPGDMNVTVARRSTTLLLTATYVGLTLDQTDIETDAAVIEHDSVNTERLLLKEAGPYQITYDIDADLTSTASPEARILVNGTTEILGSFDNGAVLSNNAKVSMTTTIAYDATADDYIEVQVRDTGSSKGTVRVNSILQAVRLTGKTGPAGPAGPPGDLPVVDTTSIVKGSADATKQVRFEVDGLTTATTRVITVPDQNVTLIDTADSRLSDDRTASGLRSATTVVSVSAATAPTTGQVLKATSGTAATWQADTGGGGAAPRIFDADQLLTPNSADWAVNALAPAVADSNNAALNVRRFDDILEEGVGVIVRPTVGATNIVVKPTGRAETGPAGARTVGLKLYNRGVPDDAAVQAWTAGTALTDIDIPITNEFFQEDSQSLTLASLNMTAGELTQIQITRVAPAGGTDLEGDWSLLSLEIEFT